MLSGLLVNESIINRLTEGDAESVRRLRSIGFTFHWMVERLLGASGEVLVVDEDGALPEGARVERYSTWHWSHRAPCADAVAEWWTSLAAVVSQAPKLEQSRLLAQHVDEAIVASALSGETAPAVYTWHRALDLRVHAWNRKLMMDRLLNNLERHGDRLVPLLRTMGDEGLLTASDWSLESRARSIPEPVAALYHTGAWNGLLALQAQGAELTLLPTGRPLLDDLIDRLRSGALIPHADTFLVQLVERQENVSEAQIEALARVLPEIEDQDVRAHLLALRRQHHAHQEVPVGSVSPPARRRRRS